MPTKKRRGEVLQDFYCCTHGQGTRNANKINSHGLYKLKYIEKNNNEHLKLKTRISPHGNEDDIKDDMKTTTSTCSPHRILIFMSIAALFGWILNIGDVVAAFPETGEAQTDMYVVQPQKSDEI